MNAMDAGVERSLLVGAIARMQEEDAAEAAACHSGVVDWSAVEGFDLFQGPILISVDGSEAEWTETASSGIAHRALERLHSLMHGWHRAV